MNVVTHPEFSFIIVPNSEFVIKSKDQINAWVYINGEWTKTKTKPKLQPTGIFKYIINYCTIRNDTFIYIGERALSTHPEFNKIIIPPNVTKIVSRQSGYYKRSPNETCWIPYLSRSGVSINFDQFVEKYCTNKNGVFVYNTDIKIKQSWGQWLYSFIG